MYNNIVESKPEIDWLLLRHHNHKQERRNYDRYISFANKCTALLRRQDVYIGPVSAQVIQKHRAEAECRAHDIALSYYRGLADILIVGTILYPQYIEQGIKEIASAIGYNLEALDAIEYLLVEGIPGYNNETATVELTNRIRTAVNDTRKVIGENK